MAAISDVPTSVTCHLVDHLVSLDKDQPRVPTALDLRDFRSKDLFHPRSPFTRAIGQASLEGSATRRHLASVPAVGAGSFGAHRSHLGLRHISYDPTDNLQELPNLLHSFLHFFSFPFFSPAEE